MARFLPYLLVAMLALLVDFAPAQDGNAGKDGRADQPAKAPEAGKSPEGGKAPQAGQAGKPESGGEKKRDPAFAPVVDESGLPRVLIIGDSISIGYTLGVRERLKGVANVHRIPENGGSTRDGLEKLEGWLKVGGGAGGA